MTAHHAWTVVCQKSITDKETDNISLDVLEQLNIKVPPLPDTAKGIIFPVHIEIISLWYREPQEQPATSNVRLKLFSSSHEEIFDPLLVKVDLSNHKRFRMRVPLERIPLPKDAKGNFYFTVEVESGDAWIEVARTPLEINLETLFP